MSIDSLKRFRSEIRRQPNAVKNVTEITARHFIPASNCEVLPVALGERGNQMRTDETGRAEDSDQAHAYFDS